MQAFCQKYGRRFGLRECLPALSSRRMPIRIELSEYVGCRRSDGSVFSLFDRRRGSASRSFLRTSTTSRVNAFPRGLDMRKSFRSVSKETSAVRYKSAIHNVDKPVGMGKMRGVWGARLGNGRPTPVVREFIAFRSVRDRGRRVRRLESCLFRRRQ